jgi:predicted AAA+ superfamily ATPase
MMMLPRLIMPFISASLQKDRRVIIIYGPRQVGKTTLLTELEKTLPEPLLKFSGDDQTHQDALGVHALEPLKKLVGETRCLIIDEAQRIPNIGLSLKLLFDHTDIQIIATGSSTFDLANRLQEPLTGRTRQFLLYPFSYEEIQTLRQPGSPVENLLEEKLRFGMYPKTTLLTGEKDKEEYLLELLNGYLYKDLLVFETLRKPKKVIDLLTLLSLQIGSEVSVVELAEKLSINKLTVESYLDILEKMFVIVNLRGLSRNLRKEVYKTSKYYFVDLGLRNALIRNFNRLSIRNDTGELFENFCFIERLKYRLNQNLPANRYFWRTYDKKEIDLIEEADGKLHGYEFKWTGNVKPINRKEFEAAYPGSVVSSINKDNFENLMLKPV